MKGGKSKYSVEDKNGKRRQAEGSKKAWDRKQRTGRGMRKKQ